MRLAVCLVVLIGTAVGCQRARCSTGTSLPDGPRLRYEIDWDDALDRHLRALGHRLAYEVEVSPSEIDFQYPGAGGMLLKAPDAETTDQLEKAARKRDAQLRIVARTDDALRLALTESASDEYRHSVASAIVRAVNASLLRAGFEEALARNIANKGFEVAVPKGSDLEQVKRAVQDFQALRFVLAHDDRAETFFGELEGELPDGFKICEIAGVPSIVKEGRRDARKKLEAFFEDRVPEHHIVGYEFAEKDDTGKLDESAQRKAAQESAVLSEESFEQKEKCPPTAAHWRTHLFYESTRIANDDVLDARVVVDEHTSRPVLTIDFTEKGAKRLHDVTLKNVEGRLALIVGQTVYSAPSINEPIPGGRLQLSLGLLTGFAESRQKATELADLLRAHSTPVQLELKSTETPDK